MSDSERVSVTFLIGGAAVRAEGVVGERLLDTAWRYDIDIEGTCGGAMACSTCHVIVASEFFARLAPPLPDELDLLDLAAGLGPTSRLACQIRLGPVLDGITVALPGAAAALAGT